MENDEGDGSETGTLATSVTDRPVDIDDFESCVITIEGIWVKPDGASSDEESDDGVEGSSEEPTTSEEDGTSKDADGTGVDDAGTESGENDPEDSGRPEEPGGTVENEGRQYIGFDEPQKRTSSGFRGRTRS